MTTAEKILTIAQIIKPMSTCRMYESNCVKIYPTLPAILAAGTPIDMYKRGVAHSIQAQLSFAGVKSVVCEPQSADPYVIVKLELGEIFP